MTLSLPPREIRIRRRVLDKLLLYAERCPVEIGGLGTVEEERGDLEALQAAIDREILEKVRAYVVVHVVIGSEGIAGTIAEYPVPLTLEPTRSRHDPGDARQRK